MLTRQAGGYLEKKGDGREERLCKSASHHIQPIRQLCLENLKITIFRKGFSSIEEPPLILKCQLFM